MNDLVVATGNKGKLREFKRIFAPLGVKVFSAAELGFDVNPNETGTTFAENAKIKAQAVQKLCGLPTIADDSGLCVDALNGAPGVYSARYAGENGTDEQCVQKLLDAMRNVADEKRTAHFACAICCLMPDGAELTAEGCCYGKIGYERHGSEGFGYDPVFLTEQGCFAEITGAEKDALSHRGKALRAFYEKYKKYNSEVENIANK
ncbi:MAG: RdgB/HAM1 family non-canonical purine NTP pyrophosphatase [Hydrogenoanaerobacterium sp.]